MNRTKKAMVAALITTGVFGTGMAFGKDVKVMLSGKNEVPAVTTSASGEGTISVADDGAVSGSVSTKGVQGTAAHIHMGKEGANGPVIVPFTKDGNTFKAPAGAKLTADQLKAFQAGETYFNVHSDANKGGEIRGQLK